MGRAWIHGRAARALAALALAAPLGACVISERAEEVYRRQLRALGALAEAISEVEGEQPALAKRLYRVEDDLYAACAPLREAGARKIAGRPLDRDLGWAVFTALDDCARQTAEVERLLGPGGPNGPISPAGE